MIGKKTINGNLIFLVIPGTPIGKPRMTRKDKWAKRDCVMQYRSWSDVARMIAGKLPPVESVISLNFRAFFKPPASWSESKRASSIGTLHRFKPDSDNILKAIMDTLYESDSAIARGSFEKVYDLEPRVEVIIEMDQSC